MPKGRYTLNYIQRQVTMTINFPEDMVICDVCDFNRQGCGRQRLRCGFLRHICWNSGNHDWY